MTNCDRGNRAGTTENLESFAFRNESINVANPWRIELMKVKGSVLHSCHIIANRCA
jgi:hypothetical protein